MWLQLVLPEVDPFVASDPSQLLLDDDERERIATAKEAANVLGSDLAGA